MEPGIYLVVSINPNFVFGQDRFAEPSREDYFDFLVRCYFGEGKNLLLLCVQRAYLDLNRTLHGFASHSGAEGLRKQAHQCLATSVIKLKKIESSKRRFDLWHRKTCSEVRELYRAGGFERFTFGQAQKWVNMTLKYVFSLGDARLPGFQSHYPFAHVPIDNVFVEAALPYGGPSLPVPWSRLDDYAVYMDFQTKYRFIFDGSAPLAAEFRLWITGETAN